MHKLPALHKQQGDIACASAEEKRMEMEENQEDNGGMGKAF